MTEVAGISAANVYGIVRSTACGTFRRLAANPSLINLMGGRKGVPRTSLPSRYTILTLLLPFCLFLWEEAEGRGREAHWGLLFHSVNGEGEKESRESGEGDDDSRTFFSGFFAATASSIIVHHFCLFLLLRRVCA